MVARWVSPGAHLVAAASDRPDLVVHAALEPSGAISLLLVNESPGVTYRVALPSGLDGPNLRVESYGTPGGAISVNRLRGPVVRVAPSSLAVVSVGS
jgi:hypothetical protein